MPEYTLSSQALTGLLLAQEPSLNPHPIPPGQENQGPVDPVPWLTAHTAAQLALLQVKVLQDLKEKLPAEVHGVLDDEIQMTLQLDSKALKWDYCPWPLPRPIPWPRPWPRPIPIPWPPPPDPRWRPLELASLSAHYLKQAHLHPAVAKLGETLMHQAVRQLNTGHH